MRRRTFLTAAFFALPGLALAQQRPEMITPENALERAFLAALDDASQRDAFRDAFLNSQVAIAMASDSSDSAPREIQLREGLTAGAVFTSTTRLNAVLGPASARRVTSGRDALTRLRGKNVVLNFRLAPMLTLEPEDVAEWLA